MASIIAEEAFEYLDAPVRVLGALDAPVPYSPPLEEFFLVSQKQIEEAARKLIVLENCKVAAYIVYREERQEAGIKQRKELPPWEDGLLKLSTSLVIPILSKS